MDDCKFQSLRDKSVNIMQTIMIVAVFTNMKH